MKINTEVSKKAYMCRKICMVNGAGKIICLTIFRDNNPDV